MIFELRILLRDFLREWRGRPPSKYPGHLFHLRYQMLRNPVAVPDFYQPNYRGGKYFDRYLSVLIAPISFAAQVIDLIRWRFKSKS